jgi:tetratricopeptide (TPR) repeat protein
VAAGGVFADYQDGLNAYSFGDYEEAMQEWLAVAEGPADAVVPTIYSEAHYAIAMLYWNGHGVRQDYGTARDWLMRAAVLEHAGAQAKLGFMYTDGLGVSQDYEEALEWFSRAAKGGNIDGLYNLGIFYLYGWGVEQDRVMAKQYLASASAVGDPDSEAALQRLMAEDEAEEAARQAQVAAFLAQIPPRRELPRLRLEELPVEEPSRYGDLEDERWILMQDPENFTIQVMALGSFENLERAISGYQQLLEPLAVYRLENEGSPLFVLVQGNYPDVDAARAARDMFPARVQRPSRVWIRKFEMVQRLVRAERRE